MQEPPHASPTLPSRIRAAVRGGAVVALLAALSVSAHTRPDREARVATDVFERFQSARAEAGLAAADRNPTLDGVALARARRVAALPHADRLTVADPVADAVHEAGIKRYRQVAMHLDMQRGFTDPAAAFERNWARHPSWRRAMDARYESVGLGVARGEDDWLVLVVVLLDPLALPTDLASLEMRVAAMVNRERVRHGLSELGFSDRLSAVARRHSENMSRLNFFDHTAPDGSQVGDRVRDAGQSYRVVAENIYRVRGDEQPAKAAVEAWMNSPGHRKNILGDGFGYTGVGIVVDEAGNVFFTQVFLGS